MKMGKTTEIVARSLELLGKCYKEVEHGVKCLRQDRHPELWHRMGSATDQRDNRSEGGGQIQRAGQGGGFRL